jgi:mannose-6-phosphate isomerase-like protein (cupin superfamily)
MPTTRALCIVILGIAPLLARDPLQKRIVSTDPSKYRVAKSVHGGAGELHYTGLFDARALDTNLQFLHRGVLQPKSGIGAHFHNQCEEMFVILDGEAEFTIDGRTSVLKGPAGAPVRMGHSHAIYNHTDKPVQWMNINVTAMRGSYDAFDLGDPRLNVQVDPIPVFMSVRFDRSLLRPLAELHGGKGAVTYRRALGPTIFLSPWAYVDHLAMASGATLGPHLHREVAEVYYVMKGQGTVTVSSPDGKETAPIREGDAIPIHLSDVHSFENNGAEPLEFLVIGVSRDNTRRVDIAPAGSRPF